MIIPDGFEFKNNQNVDFKVQLLTNNDQPFKGIRVAFEDLCPSKGDCDLNDVVVDFQCQVVTDATNRTKDIKSKYKLKAACSVFRNGFSEELSFNVSELASVSGNGLEIEAGSTKAILKVHSNSKAITSGDNTLIGLKYTETETINSAITLSNSKNITKGNFNPLIYVDEPGKGRGYEVHLTGQTPASLDSSAVLGTNADATTPSKGIYNKTKNNLPFAIAIPERFAYPSKKTKLVLAHLRFASLAKNGGSRYTDCYQNKSGYRNANKFCIKP